MLKKMILFVCLFTIICMFPYNAIADDEQNSKLYVISSFEKGLNSHINEYANSPNTVQDCRNVRFNEKYGGVSKRNELISYGDTAEDAVTGLYRYYKSDDTAHLIASGGTSVYYGTDSDGSFTVLRDGLQDGQRWQCETYQDNAIGVNGYDVPWKWDGSTSKTADTADNRTALNMCADLGAPYADLSTGTDLSASQCYQYTVIFYDDSNYYYTDARSNPLTTGNTVYTIGLSDIPLGISGTTERQIYRTEASASIAAVEAVAMTDFKYVATLSDNSTTIYLDQVADGSLGANWSSSGHTEVTPPLGKYTQVHRDRLFITGNRTYQSDLYWSEQYYPGFFLATSYEPLRPDDGGEVSFLKILLGKLVIGKTNSMQIFHADGSVVGNWGVSDPYNYVGCHAPYSVAVTPKGIIYLNRFGLYMFDGQYSHLISDAVTPHIRDIDQANILECAGAYYDNEYQLAYTSDQSGSANNDRVLLYDLIRDAYTLDYKNVNCMATLNAGTDYGALYYGSSNNGYVYAEGAAETSVVYRYKSEFDAGTYDDMRAFGGELSPELKLAWDLTWGADFQTLGYLTIGSMLTQTYAREDTDGSWTSPVEKINANVLEKIYWHERLNGYGDVDMSIRLSDSSSGCEAETWSALYSTPAGSDISGVTANTYLQIRADLSTSDILYTPELYSADNFVIKLVYDKVGASYESSVNTFVETQWFEPSPGQRSLIKSVKVYYTKDDDATGDITFNIKGSEGDTDESFTIDLDRSAYVDTRDTDGKLYHVVDGDMVFTYGPAADAMANKWKLSFSENSIYQYTIKRIELLVWTEDIEYL